MAEQPDQEAHGEFRDDLEDVHVHRDVHQRQSEKKLRDRQLGDAEEEDRDQRRGQYGDIPGYVTWNARVGYDFGPQASNLKLGLGVKNLFDKQYFTRSSDNNSGIYVGQPRTLFMQASVGF